MTAALEHLAERAAGRRTVAVLGDMAELGPRRRRLPPRDRRGRGRDRRRGARRRRPARARLPRGRARRPGDPLGATTPRTRCRSIRTPCSGRATASCSRARARWASRSSPTRSRSSPRRLIGRGRVLLSGHHRHGDLDRGGAEVHRVPAPQRARPADPRGGPRRPRRQAGHADDGRPPDHDLDVDPVPRSSRSGRCPRSPSSSSRSAARRSASSDDWTKLTHRRSLGLPGRWKLLLLGGHHRSSSRSSSSDADFKTSVYLPARRLDLPLGFAWYGLLFVIIAGAANGVNLTDGLDGLAAGTSTIALFTYTAMGVVAYLVSVRARSPDPEQLDLAILGASLIGASIGFLWYNAFPAQVFMGDTGSMGLGGALAAFAIMTKTEALLLLIGGDLRDRGALGDHPGGRLQVDGPARVPDGAAPPPLRDEGVVGDPDHGALLDHRRRSSAPAPSSSTTATSPSSPPSRRPCPRSSGAVSSGECSERTYSSAYSSASGIPLPRIRSAAASRSYSVRRSSTSGREERPARARLVLVRHPDAAARSPSGCPPTTRSIWECVWPATTTSASTPAKIAAQPLVRGDKRDDLRVARAACRGRGARGRARRSQPRPWTAARRSAGAARR